MITTEERLIYDMLSAKIGTNTISKPTVKKMTAKELKIEKEDLRKIVDTNPANCRGLKKFA